MSGASRDSKHTRSHFSGITGVILAGGKSSRYGRNKALLEIDGTRLIERVIRIMGSLFQHLILITNTPHEYAYLKLPMHEDMIKDLGPLGGIYTGLATMSDETGFFVACDMPFLNEDLIRYIVEVRNDFDAVVPKIDWKIEALHALYRKSCLPAIKDLIDSQEHQVVRFFHKVRVRDVGENEIRTFDPRLRSFININSPHELLGAKKLIG